MVNIKVLVIALLVMCSITDARRPLHNKNHEFERNPLVSADSNVNHALGTRHSPLV